MYIKCTHSSVPHWSTEGQIHPVISTSTAKGYSSVAKIKGNNGETLFMAIDDPGADPEYVRCDEQGNPVPEPTE